MEGIQAVGRVVCRQTAVSMRVPLTESVTAGHQYRTYVCIHCRNPTMCSKMLLGAQQRGSHIEDKRDIVRLSGGASSGRLPIGPLASCICNYVLPATCQLPDAPAKTFNISTHTNSPSLFIKISVCYCFYNSTTSCTSITTIVSS